MRRTAVRAIVLAAIGALLLVAAACGGDDDESAAATEAAAAVTEAADTAEAETEESEESEEAPTVPDFTGSEECQELVELGTKASAALGGAGSGDDVEQTKELFDEFADQAPEEIREDFKVIAEAYAKIAVVAGDLQVDPGETPSPEALQKLQEITAELDQERLTEANTNITAWVQENCSGAGR